MVRISDQSFVTILSPGPCELKAVQSQSCIFFKLYFWQTGTNSVICGFTVIQYKNIQ